MDLQSLAVGALGWNYTECSRDTYPKEWLGGISHNHSALDDARGYAALLMTLIHLRQINTATFASVRGKHRSRAGRTDGV